MDSPTRRSRRTRKDDCSGQSHQTQSLATSLIIFIFVVYGCGFLSTVMSLPPLNPKEVLSFYKNIVETSDSSVKIDLDEISKQRGVGLNIAKDGFEWSQDDDDKVAEEDLDTGTDDRSNTDSIPLPQVPIAQWPVSATKERNDWYEIPHPGDNDIKLDVPPFWSSPVHNNTLMKRSLAMSIGTCAKPDKETGSFQIGDNCPTEDRTIFVAIASYRDWQCRYTLESIFNRAKYPHRIRVGIVDQIVEGDDICDHPIEPCEDKPEQALCKYIDQVDNFVMDAPLSVGPVFARHIGHRLYRGEYYAMQSDAHVTFTQGKYRIQSTMQMG